MARIAQLISTIALCNLPNNFHLAVPADAQWLFAPIKNRLAGPASGTNRPQKLYMSAEHGKCNMHDVRCFQFDEGILKNRDRTWRRGERKKEKVLLLFP